LAYICNVIKHFCKKVGEKRNDPCGLVDVEGTRLTESGAITTHSLVNQTPLYASLVHDPLMVVVFFAGFNAIIQHIIGYTWRPVLMVDEEPG
jgi:hypothetical protein